MVKLAFYEMLYSIKFLLESAIGIKCFVSTRLFLQVHTQSLCDVALVFLLLTMIFQMLVIILNLTLTR